MEERPEKRSRVADALNLDWAHEGCTLLVVTFR
jgi:hypothetical protein